MKKQRKPYFSDEYGDTRPAMQKLNSLVSPLQVAQRLGLPMKKVGSELSIPCPDPSHNDSHLGSCRFNADGTLLYCFVCNKSFTALDLFMANGYSWYDAMWEMAKMAGIEDEFIPDGSTPAKSKTVRHLPYDKRKLIGLATTPKIKMITGGSDERPTSGLYSKWKTGEYISYETRPDPLLEMEEEEPEAAEELIRMKAKEQLMRWELFKEGVHKQDWMDVVNGIEREIYALYLEYGGEPFKSGLDFAVSHLVDVCNA